MIFGMDNNKPYINLSIVPAAYKLYMLKEMQRFTPNDNLYYQLRDLPVPTGVNTTIDFLRFIYKTFLKYWILSENFKKCMNYMMNNTSYYIVPSFGCNHYDSSWWTYGGVAISVLRECPNKANHYFMITFNQKLAYRGGYYISNDAATYLAIGIHFIKVADNKADKFKEILNTYYRDTNKSLETLESRYSSDDLDRELTSSSSDPEYIYASDPIKYVRSFADKYDNTITNGMSSSSYLSYKAVPVNLSPNGDYAYRIWHNFNPNGLNVVQWNSIYTSQSMLDQINYTSNKLYLFNPNEAIRYADNGLSIYINRFLNVSIDNVGYGVGTATFTDNPSNPAILLDIRTNESVLTTSNSPTQEHTDLSIWTNDTIKADVVTASSTAVLRKATGPRDTEGNASSLWLSSPKVEIQVNNKYLIKKLSNQYQTNITLNNIEYISPVDGKKYVLSVYYQVLSSNNMATMTVLSKTEVTN